MLGAFEGVVRHQWITDELQSMESLCATMDASRSRLIYRATLLLALAAYGTSLLLPSIFFVPDQSLQTHLGRPLPTVDYGFQVLEWGWAVTIIGNFAWWA